ncbi:MAG: type II toxin-antitoxin system VapC family toxin [Wenzhouxiangellaceae bacterium]|nr:type II toxin-antitoxin system VapC family toxin [Wenzhouxiangellaceae bacterium]
MIGLDTSFLVGLTIREHPVHAACLELFETGIRGRAVSAAICAQVLGEFSHVVTDPRRFSQPLQIGEALEICNQWWSASECRVVEPTQHSFPVFVDWMQRHRLGRKRVLDTLLAANYHSAGIKRIATTDWRDFRIFGVFDIVHLTSGHQAGSKARTEG